MKRMKRRCRLLSSLCLLMVLLLVQPATALDLFWSGDVDGTVVDAVSGRPLEGVVVTASWVLLHHFLDTTVPIRTLKVAETVTDRAGRYTLPGLLPGLSLIGYLKDQQPVVRFFRDGYVPLVVENNSVYHPGFEGDTEHLIKREFQYEGGRTGVRTYEPEEHMVRFGSKATTFRLAPFAGSGQGYVALLTGEYHGSRNYLHSLDYLKQGNDCEWVRLPVTFSTLHKLKARLEREGVTTYELPYVSHVWNQDTCGRAEELFSDYLE